MSNKTKACIVIDALTIRRGGGLVLLQNLALALCQSESISLHLLCNPTTELPELEGNHRVVISRPLGTQSALGAFSFRQRKLDGYLDDLDKNCTLLAFNAWSKSKHKQITLHINTIPFLPFKQRVNSVGILRAFLLKRASQKALKHSILNIFESQYLLQIAQDSCSTPIQSAVVRHFGSDLKRFSADELPPLAKRCKQIITVTSAAKHKQNHKLIQAFLVIRKNNPELELLVVGNEELIRQDIAQSYKKTQVEQDGVKYAGYLSRDELAHKLKESEVLISLSTTESFYLVAIEAMFCGTPVIAKRIASAEESCGSHAILLEDDTAESVMAAYEKLMDEDTWASYSHNAHKHSEVFESKRCMQTICSDILEATKI